MFAQLSDPAQLAQHVPVELTGIELRFIVTARDTAEDSIECTFTAKNRAFLDTFWDSCYANFGHDPASRIIIVINEDTPMTDPVSGLKFRNTSFMCVQDGRAIRFDAQDAREFLRESDRHSDIPRSSLTS